MSFADAFRRIVEHLNQCNFNYMVVGSFASSYYGAPRSTADIDLVIEATPGQLTCLVADLQASDYYMDRRIRTAGAMVGRETHRRNCRLALIKG